MKKAVCAILAALFTVSFLISCSSSGDSFREDMKKTSIPDCQHLLSETVIPEVAEEDVFQAALIWMEMNGVLADKGDAPAEGGDTLAGFLSVDGGPQNPFETVLGEDDYPLSADLLAGHCAGDTVTSAQNGHIWKIVLSNVYAHPDAVNDDIAVSFGYADAAELCVYIRRTIAQQRIIETVFSEIVKSAVCPTRSTGKRQFIRNTMKQINEDAYSAGIDPSIYILEAYGMNESEYRDMLEQEYDEMVILAAATDSLGLYPDEDDLKAWAEDMAADEDISYDDLLKMYGRERLRYSLCCELLEGWIKNNSELI